MHQSSWTEEPPPVLTADPADLRTWPLYTPGQLTLLRMQLRDEIHLSDGPAHPHEDDLERLLLAFEELASNGLRHGREPVTVTIITTTEGWLIDVTDAATDRAPIPATGRDPAQGGLGLPMVSLLAADHGWSSDAARKHVWAYIRLTPATAATR